MVMEYKNKVIIGDCFDVLRQIPDNTFDSVVTDPPYGLSQEPDIYEVLTKWLANDTYNHNSKGFMNKEWDSFVPGPHVWKEVYRVLKPGGHLLCFAGTRTEDLMSIAIRMAGFERRDLVEWLYFSGFPKSVDVGKKMDEKVRGMAVRKKILQIMRSRGMTAPELSKKAGLASPASIRDWLVGGHVPSDKNWEKIKKALELTPEEETELERIKIGEGKAGLAKGESRRNGSHKVGYKETYDITAPATDLAKKWDGWGTALKPSHEPIILARKPLEGTVADNLEKWGTCALNIDDCRIPMNEEDRAELERKASKNIRGKNKFFGGMLGIASRPDDNGRFPANCITLEDDQFYSKYFNITPKELSKKASKKDRNSDWQGNQIDIKNNHPTVKPVPLMEWLIKLVTQPGGIVLDPFAGSGSTLVAAKKNGFNYVGIELNEEYVEIARKRLGE